MDNVTHTLVGLTVAELALRFVPAEKRPSRSYAWTLSAVANNFPDLDIVYAPYLSGEMSYLLHHRGHTHTFLAGIFQTLAVFGGGWLWSKFRKREVSVLERNLWALLCVLGPILHIGLDYLNSYGVHPFWPFDNRWLYGDTLFIIEPSLWVALIPPLFMATPSRILRAIFGAIFASALLLSWFTPYVPVALALGLTVFGMVSWSAAFRRKSRFAWGFAVLFFLIFFGVGKFTRAKVQSIVAQPGVTVHDIILSPLPANPFCWTVITVERQGEDYRLRKGIVAPFPAVFAPQECPRVRLGDGTMPRVPASIASDRYIMWTGEWQEKWARLEELDHSHCGFSAFTHFARAPFVVNLGNQLVVGDARYDMDEDLGFAEFIISQREPSSLSCPAYVPPWSASLFAR